MGWDGDGIWTSGDGDVNVFLGSSLVCSYKADVAVFMLKTRNTCCATFMSEQWCSVGAHSSNPSAGRSRDYRQGKEGSPQVSSKGRCSSCFCG